MKKNMYNNIFTGKYGPYSSEYELSNGYIKPKNYNKVNKHVYLASLLNKINFDFLNNIDIVYSSNNGVNPVITIYVNGTKNMVINLNEETYEDINQKVFKNTYLKQLMKKAINDEDFFSFYKYENVDGYIYTLPKDRKELKNYEKYIDYSSKNSRAIIINDLLEVLSPFLLFGIAKAINAANLDDHNINFYIKIILVMSGLGYILHHISRDNYSCFLEEISTYIDRLKYYSLQKEEIKKQYEELDILSHNKDIAKNDFYQEIKKAVSIVNKLPEEDRNYYFKAIRIIVKDFDQNIKSIGYNENYEETLNNIVGDSIKKLYACIPLFNTAEVVITEDNKDKVFSL